MCIVLAGEARTKHLGVSRVYAERQIHNVEEFGVDYHRFGEVMPISPGTYRLIAGAVSDEGLSYNGECIPLTRKNRDKLAAAVTVARARTASRPAARRPAPFAAVGGAAG